MTPEQKEPENAGRGVKIMFHGCPHDYQDKTYGSQKRVFNKAKNGWRCTVCAGIATT